MTILSESFCILFLQHHNIQLIPEFLNLLWCSHFFLLFLFNHTLKSFDFAESLLKLCLFFFPLDFPHSSLLPQCNQILLKSRYSLSVFLRILLSNHLNLLDFSFIILDSLHVTRMNNFLSLGFLMRLTQFFFDSSLHLLWMNFELLESLR